MRISDWSSDVCSSDLAITLAAPEDEHMTTERVFFKLGLYDGGQAIKASAHVGGASRQPHPRSCRQADHCSASRIVRNNAAEHLPSNKSVPLGRLICSRSRPSISSLCSPEHSPSCATVTTAVDDCGEIGRAHV